MAKFKDILPSDIAVSTAAVLSVFEGLDITTSAMREAYDMLDAMRIAHRNGYPGDPRRAAFFFAPSHSGKSHTVRSYIVNKILPVHREEYPEDADHPDAALLRKQKKVIHVTLTAEATPKSLASDLLRALGDPTPNTGTKDTLWRRAYGLLNNLGVELVVVDEIQHLGSRKTIITEDAEVRYTEAQQNAVADTLKVMLIHGIPMLFVGIKQARALLSRSTQLTGRIIDEIAIPNLDWSVPDQRQEFLQFLGRLAIDLKKSQLLDEAPQLVYGDTPAHLYVASNGRLGMVCRIVEKATILAVRAKRRVVTIDDLVNAVDAVVVARGELRENPFRGNPKTLSLK